ncbi:MAG: type II toxin-antitoxin system VapC family toxin [Candidatus Poribacteria bacterium]|nr:type II toxin-antitoxin system VapC family toxin [Candidatus Poribacteria bacterium]
MIHYATIKPKVYIETTVISYLVARPSSNLTVTARQQASQQLWEEYFDNFEFLISDIVISEAIEGDSEAAQRRRDVLAALTILHLSPAADAFARHLIDTGAVPESSLPDAQHIAIATVHSIDYLVSWNYRHIVNEVKRQHINEVCRDAGYQPTTLCTPTELIEEIQMKENLDTQTDPILEECYRMKDEFAAKFKTHKELYNYLQAESVKRKKEGWKYITLPVATPHKKN